MRHHDDLRLPLFDETDLHEPAPRTAMSTEHTASEPSASEPSALPPELRFGGTPRGDESTGTLAAGGTDFTVEVIRSARRRRTVGAELRGDTLRVMIPSWMSHAEEVAWVDRMVAGFRRKRSAERIDLTTRATTLARRHELPRPREIRWADDMTTRWGSCTVSTGSIRISTRLAPFPDWVIDYVIIHELCHLEVRGHGPDFWRLVHRYPKAERAIGYLIAKSGEDDLDEG